MTFDFQTVIYGGAIAIIAVWNAAKEWRERKASRDFGIKGNPTRCAENMKAIAKLDDRMDKVEDSIILVGDRMQTAQSDIKEIRADIKEIRADMRRM